MKYIIDIPDDRIRDFVGSTHLLMPYTMAGHKGYHDTELELTPYAEPDRKAIEDEVWKLADTIHGMSIQDKMSCFGFSLTSAVTLNLSYQEAKAKYEAWKKKGVIHVGDEIMSVEDDVKAVMLDCADYESIYVMTEHGCVERWKDLDGVKKTGRKFPEVAELSEKMGGVTDENSIQI